MVFIGDSGGRSSHEETSPCIFLITGVMASVKGESISQAMEFQSACSCSPIEILLMSHMGRLIQDTWKNLM